MHQKNNATLKFLQNKYHRNNSLNEKLLFTLKQQAKSHAQSPVAKDSLPLNGFLDVCGTSPDQEMYRRVPNFSQSVQLLKQRVERLNDQTRNQYKVPSGVTMSSNTSHAGPSGDITPLFLRKDSNTLISEGLLHAEHYQNKPERSLQFDSTNIFSHPIAEHRSANFRNTDKNPLRFCSERKSLDLCEIQMEESQQQQRNAVFGRRNNSSDALKMPKVRKNKNLFVPKKLKDSSRKYTDFSKITETKSKAYLQQQVAKALRIQELAKIKAEDCKDTDDIQITMADSKLPPQSPILPFQNTNHIKSENCLTTVESKPRIKVARHKIRFKTQQGLVVNTSKQSGNFLSRLMEESVAEVEKKKSHKMVIQTGKLGLEKSVCPPPSIELLQNSLKPGLYNAKQVPEKYRNTGIKKRHQSLLDEVDQEDLHLELN